ncbi:hypothetical protein AGMMS49579_15680 [Spirochaetia bacterium]|nr:hypothetical protein AGMMS49579_15680 [Spirochaetia bacterium]
MDDTTKLNNFQSIRETKKLLKNNGYKVTREYKKITSQDDFDKFWWDSVKIVCSEKGDDFSFPEDLIEEMELQTDYEIKAQFFDINNRPETEIEKAFHFALEGFNKQFKIYDRSNKTWIFSILGKAEPSSFS